MIEKLTITIVLETFQDGPPKYFLINAENVDPLKDAETLANRARSAIQNTLTQIGEEGKKP